ncbi:ACT domain-containing protein [Microbacterium mcarthurae (nom. nud.)]|uniref:DUF222 domain-containing protein n=1 Tax=Microbacterium mcarthurae TaxID=3035918 RepID=A0ABW9GFQ8_9MICO
MSLLAHLDYPCTIQAETGNSSTEEVTTLIDVATFTPESLRGALALLDMSEGEVRRTIRRQWCAAGHEAFASALTLKLSPRAVLADLSPDQLEVLEVLNRQSRGDCPCGTCAPVTKEARAAFRAWVTLGMLIEDPGHPKAASALRELRELALSDGLAAEFLAIAEAARRDHLDDRFLRWPLRLGLTGPGTCSRPNLRPGRRRPPSRLIPVAIRQRRTAALAPRAPGRAAL